MGKLLPSLIAASASASKMFTVDTRSNNIMQMTEFDIIPGQNGISSNKFDLCKIDGTKNDCNGDYMHLKNPCAAMTDGGTYLMVTEYGDIWKLGACGFEKQDGIVTSLDQGRPRFGSYPYCGTVPGGALFCGGRECHMYKDADNTWTALPQMTSYHSEGAVFTKNGEIFVMGGTSGENNVERYDGNGWTLIPREDTNIPKEYKGFSIANGPGDAFYTFKGFDCGTGGNWTCGYNDESYDIRMVSENEFMGYDLVGPPKSVMTQNYETTGMYRTFNSRYYEFDNAHILYHTQLLSCRNETGSAFDWASENGLDLSNVDQDYVYATCFDGAAQAPTIQEVEYYTHDAQGWHGPNFYFSEGTENGVNFLTQFTFFWEESNLKDQDTCYIDLCKKNCPDVECQWGFIHESGTAWYQCEETTAVDTTTTDPGTTTTVLDDTTTTPTEKPYTTTERDGDSEGGEGDDDDDDNDGHDEPILHFGSCFVNNGGCTHDCNMASDDQYACDCPACWSMSDDGLTCVPSPDSITTLCGPNEMVIRMNKCVLENSHDWTTARMIDGPDCTFAEDENDADYVILRNGLDQCGMDLSFENDTLTYSNKLQVNSAMIGGMIVTKPAVTWGFSCTYDTEYEIGESLTVNAASISQGFSQTNAQFAFTFDFYTDGTFEEIQTEASYQVGQYINFGVKMNGGEPLDNLDFVASSCDVTNGDLTYTVYDMNNPDHCSAAPPVFFQQHASDNSASSFYSYMGFQFMESDGVTPTDSQRVSCTIRVCHQEDEDSICNMGCYNSTMTAM